MSAKTVAKSIYIFGMGLAGNNVGKIIGAAEKTEVGRLLIKGACSITGAYAGLVISNELDIFVANAMEELSSTETDEPDVEVNT